MRWSFMVKSVTLVLAGLVGAVQANGPKVYSPYAPAIVVPAPGCVTPSAPVTPSTPTPAQPPAQPAAPQPAPLAPTEMGTGAGEAGSGALAGVPGMIGDLGFKGYTNLGKGKGLRVAANAGQFRVAENEGARPTSRIFTSFNYFNNVAPNVTGIPDGSSLYRYTLGFEYAVLDGNASVGARGSYLDGIKGGGELDGFSDLTLTMKYAFINDCDTGNAVSAGLMVTIPTGIQNVGINGQGVHGFLIQPWAGFLYNMDRAYIHGFTSVVLPTLGRDVAFLANDIAVGYKLYTCNDDSLLTAIIPTLEGHLITPLNHSSFSASNAVFFPDQFMVTGGVHFGIGKQAWVTLAAGTPVTGPRPFDFELFAQLNWRF